MRDLLRIALSAGIAFVVSSVVMQIWRSRYMNLGYFMGRTDEAVAWMAMHAAESTDTYRQVLLQQVAERGIADSFTAEEIILTPEGVTRLDTEWDGVDRLADFDGLLPPDMRRVPLKRRWRHNKQHRT